MEAMERLIAGVIEEHPEYHPLLEAGDEHLAREWTPESGHENPFLHMGLHITVREQVSIDRPHGIREAHQMLCRKRGSVMAAEHAMMEVLGRILWDAQRGGGPPDERMFLGEIRHIAGLPPEPKA